MKGLFCVAWLWPGQAGGVLLLRGVFVFFDFLVLAVFGFCVVFVWLCL
jgi:hypothetical protein